MKKRRNLFEIYPHNSQATNLSIASGAARLLTILFLAAVVFVIAVIAAEGFRFASHGWHGKGLLYLVDEMDDELEMLFVLVGAAVLCGYAGYAMRRKAEVLIGEKGNVK